MQIEVIRQNITLQEKRVEGKDIPGSDVTDSQMGISRINT